MFPAHSAATRDDVDAIVKALKLQPTDAGGNVMLLSPFDDVVFERTWTADGLTLVAPSQATVDLRTSPGRAPAEAEAVLEILAKPSSRGSRLSNDIKRILLLEPPKFWLT